MGDSEASQIASSNAKANGFMRKLVASLMPTDRDVSRLAVVALLL
jgi:hypothetical protein